MIARFLRTANRCGSQKPLSLDINRIYCEASVSRMVSFSTYTLKLSFTHPFVTILVNELTFSLNKLLGEPDKDDFSYFLIKRLNSF